MFVIMQGRRQWGQIDFRFSLDIIRDMNWNQQHYTKFCRGFYSMCTGYISLASYYIFQRGQIHRANRRKKIYETYVQGTLTTGVKRRVLSGFVTGCCGKYVHLSLASYVVLIIVMDRACVRDILSLVSFGKRIIKVTQRLCHDIS